VKTLLEARPLTVVTAEIVRLIVALKHKMVRFQAVLVVLQLMMGAAAPAPMAASASGSGD